MISTTRVAKFIGSPLSLLLHTIIFGGILSLRFLGMATESLLTLLAAMAFLEAIYLIILLQTIINKNSKKLENVEVKIEEIQREEDDAHKLMINLLHTTHQIKAIQYELNTLKKNGTYKHLSPAQKVH